MHGPSPAKTERSAPRHITSHTGLRGVAALLVVLYHLQFGAAYHLAFETATTLFSRSYVFVDLFFVLSGFIISYTNQAEAWRSADPARAGQFLVARLVRIYPLHLFCLAYLLAFRLLLAVAFLAAGKEAEGLAPAQLRDFVLQALLLQAWLPAGGGGWNIPSWSISAEIAAYLAFPITAVAVSRQRIAAVALLTVGPCLFYGWIAATTGDLDILRGPVLLRCLAGFSFGILIYLWRHRIARLPDAMLSVVQLASAAAILLVLLSPSNDVLVVPPFVCLVASTWTDRGVIARLLSTRPLLWLGEISYSIYLNHVCLIQILGFFILRIMARLPADILPIARAIELGATLAVILAVSSLTYRYIERPARTFLLVRLLHRRPRDPAEQPSAP